MNITKTSEINSTLYTKSNRFKHSSLVNKRNYVKQRDTGVTFGVTIAEIIPEIKKLGILETELKKLRAVLEKGDNLTDENSLRSQFQKMLAEHFILFHIERELTQKIGSEIDLMSKELNMRWNDLKRFKDHDLSLNSILKQRQEGIKSLSESK